MKGHGPKPIARVCHLHAIAPRKNTTTVACDICRLAARVEELLADKANLSIYSDNLEDLAVRFAARVKELEECYKMCCRDREALDTENQRLREALESILAHSKQIDSLPIILLSRHALKEQK